MAVRDRPSARARRADARRAHRIVARGDVGEHRVVAVQAGVVDEIDEELRVGGVAASCRQPDRPADIARGDLVAHELFRTGILVRVGASTLEHEVRHDAVDRQTVVELVGQGELQEAIDGDRRR